MAADRTQVRCIGRNAGQEVHELDAWEEFHGPSGRTLSPSGRTLGPAEDLATQAYETARFQATSNNPPLAFPRAVILMEAGREIWRATEADLRDPEHDMDV